MDPSRYVDPGHLLPGADPQLDSTGNAAVAAASSSFFATQEASRYYQMHQAYESAATQGRPWLHIWTFHGHGIPLK